MSSLKQIEANRRNSQKSIASTGETPEAFAKLKRSFYDRIQPATLEQQTLVDSVMASARLLKRYSALEMEMWEKALSAPDPAAAYRRLVKKLNLLQRRTDAAERHFRCGLELLHKLRAASQAQPRSVAKVQSLEPLTTQIGFVPKTSKVPTDLPPAA